MRCKALCLHVSPRYSNRTFRIHNALIKVMEGLGRQVTVGGRNNDETYVVVLGEKVKLGIEEHIKQTDHALTPEEEKQKDRLSNSYFRQYDYHPTGELNIRIKEFSAGPRKRWSNSQCFRLEEKLGAVVKEVRLRTADKPAGHRERERKMGEKAPFKTRLAEFKEQREAE